MAIPLVQRLLSPIVDVRREEALTALLMFTYSFLAMTSYNIVKPITRSKFIAQLGADNLPYVLLGAGVLIGVVMSGYTWVVGRLPRRWGMPITQVGMTALLILFWFLFQTQGEWVSVAFFFVGLILGILLISQFWTLANVVYDPRQAKRLFGFIGGGAPLGGIAGSAIAGYSKQIGTNNLLIVSAVFMAVCAFVVMTIIGREKNTSDLTAAAGAKEEEGVGFQEAVQLLRNSKHLQIIALVIAFAAIGAAIIEQQLNMAAEASAAGSDAAQADAITAFLARVALWMSTIGFVIQVWLTSRIHRFLGIGFALMILPVSLGTTGILMLATGAAWAAAAARITDQSLRYTVDKTTREILFMPLPGDLKLKAKAFVDVTVDRLAKGLGALVLLFLVKDWGLGWNGDRWPLLSYASLLMTGLWILMAVQARRGYLAAFRRSIERQDVRPAELRLDVADLQTIETLIEELSSPDERRVIYAIDILESLDKRNLITPLLLYHASPAVRARALQAMSGTRPDIAERWLPLIQRLLADDDADVRAAAVAALANIRNEEVTNLIRPYLADRNSRLATTAAVVLARSSFETDVAAAEDLLTRMAADTRESAVASRKDVAAAVRQINDPRFRHLLIPLMYDTHTDVGEEALRAAQQLGAADFSYVPTLVSLLRQRTLKSTAREVLVGYGEPVLDALNHFLREPEEDIWVRRHIPATIARIPSQKSMDILVDALSEPDGFLRYKVVSAIERLRREHPHLKFNPEPVEALLLREATRYFNYLTLHYNLFEHAKLRRDSLLAHALQEKVSRTVDRVYRLLGLIYPWKDVSAARYAIERGDPRSRASAVEYLDNILTGNIRKRLMPIIEDMPLEEKVRRANVILRTRVRDVEETLLQLINDDDQVVSAAAIDLVEEQKIWALADDLEHVLGHRDVKDWYVFEAASWALAAYRMPEARRRALWNEPLPAVQLAGRLRQVPLFASVSVDELFRIAGMGRQVRQEAGRHLLQEGVVPDQVHFLLDGLMSRRSRAGADAEMSAPAVFGFEQVLEGSAMPETIKAIEDSVTLALTAEEIRAMLSENTELVEGLFRLIAERGLGRTVMQGQSPDEIARLKASGLKPIEKVFVLEAVPVFSGVTPDEMLKIASLAHEVSLVPGVPLLTQAEGPAIYALLDGQVTIGDEGATTGLTAGTGDVIGAFETLAGTNVRGKVSATVAGRALRIEREDLLDLLGQRPLLLQQVFAALFRLPPAVAEAA